MESGAAPPLQEDQGYERASPIRVARGRRRQRRRGAAAPEDGRPPQGAGARARLAAGRGGRYRRRRARPSSSGVAPLLLIIPPTSAASRNNCARTRTGRLFGADDAVDRGPADHLKGVHRERRRRNAAGVGDVIDMSTRRSRTWRAARDPRGLYKHGAVAHGPAPVDRLDHPENAPEEVPGERRRRRDGRVLRVVFALGRAHLMV